MKDVSARLVPVMMLVLALASSDCTPRSHLAPLVRTGDDAFDVVTSLRWSGGVASPKTRTPIPPSAYRFAGFRWPFGPGAISMPYDKLHPELRRRLAGGPSAAVETVLVTYEDTLRIPRFPVPVPGLGLNSAANLARQATALALVHQIQLARGAKAASDSMALKGVFGAQVIDHFWLTRAYLIALPRDSVPVLARVPEVVYIRPDRAREPEPQVNGNPGDDPASAWEVIGANKYQGAELQLGRLALLDSGVWTGHELLARPEQFERMRDCVNGGPDCNTGNTVDPSDVCPSGHGTRSAAIIGGHVSAQTPGQTDGSAASTTFDVTHDGLCRIPIDSYKVYAPDHSMPGCGMALVSSAMVHCLQDVLLSFGGVIAAEAQAEEPDRGDLALAADGAFDGGAVVIGAVGNSGIGGAVVRAPGNARRALGIGAYVLRPPQATASVQLGGWTSDRRLKPDVQAPTQIETAVNGDRHGYQGYTGTSCATAVAAGAAALFRNLILGNDESIDPGFVYAGLIAAGDRQSPFPTTTSQGVTDWRGAGHFHLPDGCRIFMTKVSLSEGEECKFDVDLTGVTVTRISTAIWWPEVARWENHLPVDSHSNLDFSIENETGSVKQRTETVDGVFERLEVAGAPGKWKVRVSAPTVRFGPQTAYVFVIAKE